MIEAKYTICILEATIAYGLRISLENSPRDSGRFVSQLHSDSIMFEISTGVGDLLVRLSSVMSPRMLISLVSSIVDSELIS